MDSFGGDCDGDGDGDGNAFDSNERWARRVLWRVYEQFYTYNT